MTLDIKALLSLLLIPIFWGAGFPLTHNIVSNISPLAYIWGRMAIATIVILPFTWRFLTKIDRNTAVICLILGLLSTGSLVSQAIALKTLNSATTAFCVSLNVAFVPVVQFVFRIKKSSKVDSIAIILALIGTWVILGNDSSSMTSGYFWGILSALAIACSIVLTGKLSENIKVNRVTLVFYQLFFGSAVLSCSLSGGDIQSLGSAPVFLTILFVGVLSSAFCLFLQIKYQNRVGNIQTALILNMDLVFAVIFGLVNSENVSPEQLTGVIIMFSAICIGPLFSLMSNKKVAAC
ncbi:DMT family transporter [Vibrio salinus]|uniref:DMT family transporter n=1 Tax=Vibrio salinus TaxID=2899784 RepID=UPI001E40D948|nr:DMT family transporter [Vibrio salinus]MCE0492901.1 DMT family transporter [Vibrio salinus]